MLEGVLHVMELLTSLDEIGKDQIFDLIVVLDWRVGSLLIL